MRMLVLFCALIAAVSCQTTPQDRPGYCPDSRQTGEMGICGYMCQGDGECAAGLKCCTTACGGTSCTTPLDYPTCATVRCPAGRKCVMKDVQCVTTPCYPQAICVEEKPGTCPEPKTDGSDVAPCAFLCTEDAECTGSRKCCKTSCGLGCQEPVLPLTCENFLCVPGKTCEMRPVQCLVPPCDIRPTCVAIRKEGLCPKVVRPSWAQFWRLVPRWGRRDCEMDSQCPGYLKCCKDYSRGTQCLKPQPELTCANVDCAPNTPICIMKTASSSPLPRPTCVAVENACDKPCASGYKCEMRNNLCFFGQNCGRSPQCVLQPVCRPACQPNEECAWEKACFFFFCRTSPACKRVSGCRDDAGVLHAVDTSFPSTDGCNTCMCGFNGSDYVIACTKRACLK